MIPRKGEPLCSSRNVRIAKTLIRTSFTSARHVEKSSAIIAVDTMDVALPVVLQILWSYKIDLRQGKEMFISIFSLIC